MDEQNGYHEEVQQVEVEAVDPKAQPSRSNKNPATKEMIVQPFNQGQQSNPVDRYMKGSAKAEDYAILTNLTAEEISRAERILYFRNIADTANGKMPDVEMYGMNLKRSLNGQASKDIVAMVIGQQKQDAQRGWAAKQQQMMSKVNKGPLNQSSPGIE